MNKIEILSSGKKIKTIRRNLKLKQHDIVGNQITRNLISAIENDKATLTKNTAIIIANNINKICKERELDFRISDDYLMQNEYDQVCVIADEYIKKLSTLDTKNNLNEEEFEEMDIFLTSWNLRHRRANLYEIIGDIYKNKEFYEKQYHYYSKAWQIYTTISDYKDLPKFAINFSSNCIKTGRYDEVISINRLVLVKIDKITNLYTSKIHYNNALSYKALKLYNEALSELEKCESYLEEDNMSLFKKVTILKANSYKILGKDNEAIDLYTNLLERMTLEKDIDEISLVYANILDLSIQNNNKDKVIEYKDSLSSLLPLINNNSLYLGIFYFNLAKAFEFLSQETACSNFFIASIKKLNEQNLIPKHIDFISYIFDYFKSREDINNLNYIISVISKIAKHNFSEDINLLLLKLVRYYLDTNIFEAKKLLDDILSK